jgi:2-dehydrotetronate isomerase
MPRFCANLTMLFTELPLMDRFRAAKEAGFDAVEVLFPYDAPAQDMRDQLVWNSLTFVLMNGPPPNFTGGPRGFAADPALTDRFRSDFRRVLRYAGVLKPRFIHVMAGRAEGPMSKQTMIDNLKWAADEAKGTTLTIEPLNQTDMPGYFLSDFDLAADILDRVGRRNVALQFDAYHAQMITGDAMKVWEAHGARAAHVQIAGVPGRHEPAGGDVDYPALFAALDEGGYRGWVSAEYNPKGATTEGLHWLPRAG